MNFKACKENGQSLCTDLVNGPAAPNSCKASASTTSESTPAVSLNGTKLQCMVNGYISHWCKGKSTKTEQKECKRISVSVTDAPAVSSLHADNSDQTTPNQPSSRKWKKFNRKKRYLDNLTATLNKSQCKMLLVLTKISAVVDYCIGQNVNACLKNTSVYGIA